MWLLCLCLSFETIAISAESDWSIVLNVLLLLLLLFLLFSCFLLHRSYHLETLKPSQAKEFWMTRIPTKWLWSSDLSQELYKTYRIHIERSIIKKSEKDTNMNHLHHTPSMFLVVFEILQTMAWVQMHAKTAKPSTRGNQKTSGKFWEELPSGRCFFNESSCLAIGFQQSLTCWQHQNQNHDKLPKHSRCPSQILKKICPACRA